MECTQHFKNKPIIRSIINDILFAIKNILTAYSNLLTNKNLHKKITKLIE